MCKSTLLRMVCIGLLLWAFAGTAVAQDDITPLVDEGRKALAAGDYQKALEYFQQVVQKIQAQVSQSFEKFMPDALSGWEAGEIESQSWAGTTDEVTHNMSHITREYTRKEDGTQCTITLSNWPQMVEGIRQSVSMYKQMARMTQSDPETQVSVEEKDEWVLLKIVEVGETATVTAVGDKQMVSIEVDRDDMSIADAYLGKIDLKGLEQAIR